MVTDLVARSIERHAVIYVSFMLLMIFSSSCSAQFIAEFESQNGKFFGGVEIGKTTDIGKFDDYVGPLLATEARSFLGLRSTKHSGDPQSKNVNQVSEYIQKSDRKLRLKYAGRLGWTFTVGYETSRFLNFDDRGLRVSVFKTLDVNSLKAFAPNGVGILIDPTAFTAEALIENAGVLAEAPFFSGKSSDYGHTTYVGLGAVRNKSRSHGIAKSDFLDISIVERRTLDRPLFSLAHRIRPIVPDDPSAFGLDLTAQAFRTTKMFNVTFNVALVKSFR